MPQNSPDSQIECAVATLKKGDIIAYPTEAVYGLGCDPFNEAAVLRLLKLKDRPIDKGLIIIAASWEQLQPYINKIDTKKMQEIIAWPTPMTWLFPATESTPKWLTGSHTSIAVRVTTHPLAKKLCEQFKNPIISTSANISGHLPAKTTEEVKSQFPAGIDFILPGELGGLNNPTEIRDAITGKVVRGEENTLRF